MAACPIQSRHLHGGRSRSLCWSSCFPYGLSRPSPFPLPRSLSLLIKSSSPFPVPGSLSAHQTATNSELWWTAVDSGASMLALSSPNSEVAIAIPRAWIWRFLTWLQRMTIVWLSTTVTAAGAFVEEGCHIFAKRIFYRGNKLQLYSCAQDITTGS